MIPLLSQWEPALPDDARGWMLLLVAVVILAGSIILAWQQYREERRRRRWAAKQEIQCWYCGEFVPARRISMEHAANCGPLCDLCVAYLEEHTRC